MCKNFTIIIISNRENICHVSISLAHTICIADMPAENNHKTKHELHVQVLSKYLSYKCEKTFPFYMDSSDIHWFQQYWFWILKIIYYQTDKCISCYMYNHFHILWELNKIRQVLWSYLSYLLDGDIKGLTFLVFGVHSLYNLLAFASSQLTCFWQ